MDLTMNAIILAAVLLMSGATEASQATGATEAAEAAGATEAAEAAGATEATVLDQYIAKANESSFTEFAKNCTLKPKDKRGGCAFLQGFLHSEDCKKEGAKKMEKAQICAAE